MNLRVAALVYLTFNFALAASYTTIAQQKTKSNTQSSPQGHNTDTIKLTVTVADRHGRYVANLKRDAFTVLDGGSPREITSFSDQDVPVSVGILIDRSASMSSKYGESALVSRVREGISRFVRSSNKSNDYFVMTVNKNPQLLLDTTGDSKAVLAALDELAKVRPGQATALYDTCYQAVEKLTRGARAKRIILLISDGLENSSRHTFRDLTRILKESDVLIYVIGVVSREPYFPKEYLTALDNLALGSGGTRFFPDEEDQLYAVLERIALELRHQYTVGIRPTTSTGDREWRRVKVSVTLPLNGSGETPRLVVRSREGYYSAPTQLPNDLQQGDKSPGEPDNSKSAVLEIYSSGFGTAFPRGRRLLFRLYKSGRLEYDMAPNPGNNYLNVVFVRRRTQLRANDVAELIELAEQPDFQAAANKYRALENMDNATFITTIAYKHRGREKKIEIVNYDPRHPRATYPASLSKLLGRVYELKPDDDRLP